MDKPSQKITFNADIPEGRGDFQGDIALELNSFPPTGLRGHWDIRRWLNEHRKINEGEHLVGIRFSQFRGVCTWCVSVFFCEGDVSQWCKCMGDHKVRELRIILRKKADILHLFRKLGTFDIFLHHHEIQFTGDPRRCPFTMSVERTDEWAPAPDQWH